MRMLLRSSGENYQKFRLIFVIASKAPVKKKKKKKKVKREKIQEETHCSS